MIEKLLGTSNSATGRGLKEGLIIPGHDLLGGFHTKKRRKTHFSWEYPTGRSISFQNKSLVNQSAPQSTARLHKGEYTELGKELHTCTEIRAVAHQNCWHRHGIEQLAQARKLLLTPALSGAFASTKDPIRDPSLATTTMKPAWSEGAETEPNGSWWITGGGAVPGWAFSCCECNIVSRWSFTVYIEGCTCNIWRRRRLCCRARWVMMASGRSQIGSGWTLAVHRYTRRRHRFHPSHKRQS